MRMLDEVSYKQRKLFTKKKITITTKIKFTVVLPVFNMINHKDLNKCRKKTQFQNQVNARED